MKKITLIIFMVLALVTIASAESTWMEGCNKTYQWTLNANNILIINSAIQLTTDKNSIASDIKTIKNICNEKGTSIFERLYKIADISKVFISNRQIAIYIFPFPPNGWNLNNNLDNTLKEIDKVLCGK